MGLHSALCKLRGTLPLGSVFEFEVLDDRAVHLERLVIPSASRGTGTDFLASVFHACDQHCAVARLEADPTDLPGDPSTFELVRWYMRFGCVIDAVDDDAVAMTRQPCDPDHGLAGMLSHTKRREAPI